ncbi:hypothetical protein SAMN02745215_01329 [Desulfitobacterium chlororespirans DSM 11544]|uniref:Uncharacterized protein n=1 Tax=Desulfitobacterium chlororespirans DSM 11544 TaxID=1121395 RepID=A0A1M7SZ48_9FIRM|nr:hypothetical protein SAMN02745215_01329 [Desulfitobacterium chlororespirans DSM 11544]
MFIALTRLCSHKIPVNQYRYLIMQIACQIKLNILSRLNQRVSVLFEIQAALSLP